MVGGHHDVGHDDHYEVQYEEGTWSRGTKTVQDRHTSGVTDPQPSWKSIDR